MEEKEELINYKKEKKRKEDKEKKEIQAREGYIKQTATSQNGLISSHLM